MILLLGASGYVGQAFQRQFAESRVPYLPVSRSELDYYRPKELAAAIRRTKADFLVNAAGYTGKPNVDACDPHRADCLEGNAVLPGRIREGCEAAGIPWGHVSSGCIYTGRREDGGGFREDDTPNFCFRSERRSFYSGTKALGEDVLAGAKRCYIWRMRMPFDHRSGPRNYLAKLLTYPRLLDAENSLSHLGDFAASCMELWEKKHPLGIYNMTNPGAVTTRGIVAMMQTRLCPGKTFDFYDDEEEFMKLAATTPRSNCVLDTSKVELAGLPMRPVVHALSEAIECWDGDRLCRGRDGSGTR